MAVRGAPRPGISRVNPAQGISAANSGVSAPSVFSAQGSIGPANAGGQPSNASPSLYVNQSVQTPQGEVQVKVARQATPFANGIVDAPVAISKNVTFSAPISGSSGGFVTSGSTTYTYQLQGRQLVPVMTGGEQQITYNGVVVAQGTPGNLTPTSAAVEQTVYGSVGGANQYLGTLTYLPSVSGGEVSLTYGSFKPATVTSTQPYYITNPQTGQTYKIGNTVQGTTAYNAESNSISAIFPNNTVNANLYLKAPTANVSLLGASTPVSYNVAISGSPALGLSATTNYLGFPGTGGQLFQNTTVPGNPNVSLSLPTTFSIVNGGINASQSAAVPSNSVPISAPPSAVSNPYSLTVSNKPRAYPSLMGPSPYSLGGPTTFAPMNYLGGGEISQPLNAVGRPSYVLNATQKLKFSSATFSSTRSTITAASVAKYGYPTVISEATAQPVLIGLGEAGVASIGLVLAPEAFLTGALIAGGTTQASSFATTGRPASISETAFSMTVGGTGGVVLGAIYPATAAASSVVRNVALQTGKITLFTGGVSGGISAIDYAISGNSASYPSTSTSLPNMSVGLSAQGQQSTQANQSYFTNELSGIKTYASIAGKASPAAPASAQPMAVFQKVPSI